MRKIKWFSCEIEDLCIQHNLIFFFQTFMCKNGECIDYHKLCNGIPDCEDGSDEDVKGQRPECKSKKVQFA